ncbi:hypothetical protein COJ96_02335 [Bacillus sp. AFS073361]|uniref:DUF3231 family protein n=1 Tax=Bacillus sp. AFS073361 TaxID=2033511 RepID=UPI000BF2B9D6|nr:DUF3231 family protein [Bacillus sp. AFS073361]PFP30822.1 hypothetical protein COJ96_02335 [Bacillus sp. AFS073361]
MIMVGGVDMHNLLETIMRIVNTVVEEEPLPLNIIEASHFWTYYIAVMDSIAFEEAGLNISDDTELKQLLKESESLCLKQAHHIEQIMRENGIKLPRVSEPKPFTDSKYIPEGVKLTGEELSNGLAIKFASMASFGATAATMSIRADVRKMWMGFLVEVLTFDIKLKSTMRKREWLNMPPAYKPA